ncbi:DUF1289 domain-containing protein [Azospirillum brasilense]|uniref:DUF1289 domain-containing protein n=1 Tax=Azospirillum brasilense TaxID=192 RepID=A0A6L3B3B8_AZOBR|nr:DUF1289 domain-containing protein [Azospirillum brasilense]KAA0685257.1 DUF1289 domain-containing protein [Azospirillum brasilense]
MTAGTPDTAPAVLVPSPCISVCKLTADRAYCIGCLRTLEEIRGWKHMDADQKRALLADLENRQAAAAE